MANGIVAIQPDSTGKKIQTFENTIGANVVEAQAVGLVTSSGVAALGDDRPAYTVSVSGQTNTASSHAIAFEAGVSKKVRLRQLVIWNPGMQTAAGLRILQLLFTTAAGTAGAVTPTKHEASDAAYSGLARAKPTGLGAAGSVILNIPLWVPAAVGAFQPIIFNWPELKAPTVAAGITNGIALLDPGAAGGANFAASMTVTEE